MEIEISTPALLFPAVSLLLLAYTNRFLAVAQLIRMLHRQSTERENCEEYKQIGNLKHRLELTKWMQFFGVLSILLCTFSMFDLFLGILEFREKNFWSQPPFDVYFAVYLTLGSDDLYQGSQYGAQ